MSGLVIGSLGASRLSDALAKTKSGWGASRANLMAELIAERLTGVAYDTYQNAAMLRGIETEPFARIAYEFYANVTVVLTEPIHHPKIKGSHASPDGLIGSDGLIEIKCPNTATHIETLLGGEIDKKYITQMQWQMAVTDRAWCDFVSFDPRMPEAMRLFVKRIERNDVTIAALEKDVKEFLSELDNKVQALRSQYELKNLLAAG